MPEYSASDIKTRLEMLGSSLARFPEGAACPWPVARIFNELVKQARQQVEGDPVLRSIRFLEEAPEAAGTMSNTLVTTVRALVDQVTLTLVPAAAGNAGEAAAGGGPAAAERKPPTARRR